MNSLDNYIPTQCLVNNTLMASISNITKSTSTLSKKIAKSNCLNGLGFMICALSFVTLASEIKAEKNELDKKISKLEEKIEELERGD